MRADVVWFGEAIPPQALQDADATVIEFNTKPTALTQLADFFLCGPSGVVLPQPCLAACISCGS